MVLLHKNTKDITGLKSRGFVVIKIFDKRNAQGTVCWECKCETCDKIRIFMGAEIRRNRIDCRCHAEYRRIRNRAKDRNIEFLITEKQMWRLLQKQDYKCALSGLSIKFVNSTNKTASLDRINSQKGYIYDNIQWVHKKINRMKMEMKQKEFIETCKLVAIQ